MNHAVSIIEKKNKAWVLLLQEALHSSSQRNCKSTGLQCALQILQENEFSPAVKIIWEVVEVKTEL